MRKKSVALAIVGLIVFVLLLFLTKPFLYTVAYAEPMDDIDIDCSDNYCDFWGPDDTKCWFPGVPFWCCELWCWSGGWVCLGDEYCVSDCGYCGYR